MFNMVWLLLILLLVVVVMHIGHGGGEEIVEAHEDRFVEIGGRVRAERDSITSVHFHRCCAAMQSFRECRLHKPLRVIGCTILSSALRDGC